MDSGVCTSGLKVKTVNDHEPQPVQCSGTTRVKNVDVLRRH